MSEDRPVPRTITHSGLPVSRDDPSLTVGPNRPTVVRDVYTVGNGTWRGVSRATS